jgi:hypothetical protein
MSAIAFEFGDTLNWNLVSRLDLRGIELRDNKFAPISPRAVEVRRRILMVGCKSGSAKSNWWLGCRASKRLLISPSSTSEFRPIVYSEQFNCPLNTLTLIKFQNDYSSPYLLVLDIPRWLSHLYVEVWEYDGTDPLETV